MSTNKTRRVTNAIVVLVILLSTFSSVAMAAPSAAPSVPVTFTILHTNDFHGQLDSSLSSSNPGSARVATIVNGVRTTVGAANVLLADVGDEMQGSLLSNLGDGTPTGKGIPTIAAYNALGYNVATFGNHEFDWGQVKPCQPRNFRQPTPTLLQISSKMIPVIVPPPDGRNPILQIIPLKY